MAATVSRPKGGEAALRERQYASDMVARGEFRHHAAIFRMHGDLRMQLVREQAGLGVVQRDSGFVAGGFNAQNQHGYITKTEKRQW